MVIAIVAIEIQMIMMKTAMAFAESSSADGVSMALQSWFLNTALL